MTPQSNFMVMAPVTAQQVAPLRALLATMTVHPGHADPDNALVPFARFEALHVARFLVMQDESLADGKAYGLSLEAPIYLTFLGDCDGSVSHLFDALVAEAGEGLRRIFSFCADFPPGADLRRWMDDHRVRPATQYVNWIGRSVRQVKEEAALAQALAGRLKAAGPLSPREAWLSLRRSVEQQGPGLTPLAPAPAGWLIADAGDLVGGVLALIVAAPFLLLYLPFFLVILRRREATDPVIPQPIDGAKLAMIGAQDDYDVTNAFSALGSLKPGLFRLSLVLFVLWLLNWANRHIYRRGRLARVGTIHFARWVLIDGNRRLLFASNYDGSLDTYMDDFINKAGFGLNMVFANGVGYPRTRFLLGEGALREQEFKGFLRRRQLPTDVWYKAYPGLDTNDLARNAQIRQGLQKGEMSDAEIIRWLALI